ncbi:hypothetical protein [Lewinella sp. LCG006]|uniref:hypothetical protein n=1 Tax=Lewinella sp. LCG006 TaxID=3231911 RepID=UPI00345FE3DE
MKTKKEWEQDITTITTKIHQEFPELSKYISEIPVNSSDKEGIDSENLKEYYNSLVELVRKYSKTHEGMKVKNDTEKSKLPGYPLYPPSEDIYYQEQKETAINPSDLSKKKAPNDEEGTLNEKGFKGHMSGDDLDVPGSELDDQQESVGSEDEENNYYSLGGDNHNDLEEHNG